MKEALKLALEALKMNPLDTPTDVYDTKYQKAIDVAREALAQPWKGLTKKEIDSALSKYKSWYEFATHLENILKEKNQ